MNLPGETEAGSAGGQPCRGITGRAIEPMFSSAGANVLALHIDNHKKSSDDRPRCLENPRPAGAESTLTENVASPFHAEPRHDRLRDRFIPVHGFTAHFPTRMRFEHRAHATQHRLMVICDEDAFCRVSHLEVYRKGGMGMAIQGSEYAEYRSLSLFQTALPMETRALPEGPSAESRQPTDHVSDYEAKFPFRGIDKFRISETTGLSPVPCVSSVVIARMYTSVASSQFGRQYSLILS
jgi:hypothetical protein